MGRRQQGEEIGEQRERKGKRRRRGRKTQKPKGRASSLFFWSKSTTRCRSSCVEWARTFRRVGKDFSSSGKELLSSGKAHLHMYMCTYIYIYIYIYIIGRNMLERLPEVTRRRVTSTSYIYLSLRRTLAHVCAGLCFIYLSVHVYIPSETLV